MENTQYLTVLAVLFSFIFLITYDVWVYVVYGPDFTISQVFLHKSQKYPIIAIGIGLIIGIVLGHIFWPN